MRLTAWKQTSVHSSTVWHSICLDGKLKCYRIYIRRMVLEKKNLVWPSTLRPVTQLSIFDTFIRAQTILSSTKFRKIASICAVYTSVWTGLFCITGMYLLLLTVCIRIFTISRIIWLADYAPSLLRNFNFYLGWLCRFETSMFTSALHGSWSTWCF